MKNSITGGDSMKKCKLKRNLRVSCIFVALVLFSVCIDQTLEETILPSNILEEDAKGKMRGILGKDDPEHFAIAYLTFLDEGDSLVIGEEKKTIKESVWFGFIDDFPRAFYAHPTRIVYIYALDNYRIEDKDWYPIINGIPIWDVDDVIVSPSLADYGDAPDGFEAYTSGVMGRFPTLFKNDGARTLNVGGEVLGELVSREIDAIDLNDPDSFPNLVDNDKDDGFIEVTLDSRFKLKITIKTAPDVPRYINILADLNKDGDWDDSSEWILQNFEVDVLPGTTQPVTTDPVSFGGLPYPFECWVRIVLTRSKIERSWTGDGEFEHGEIEDYLLHFPLEDPNEPDPNEPDPTKPFPSKPPKKGQWEEKPPEEPPPTTPPLTTPPPEEHPPLPPGPIPPLPPGPKEKCGKIKINYYALVVNGIGAKQPLQRQGKQAADGIYDALKEHHNTTYLGPQVRGNVKSQSTLENIKKAINEFAKNAKCNDKLFIYIIGHGKKGKYNRNAKYSNGGLQLSDGSILTPKKLNDLLNNASWKEGRPCNITILIESCYAGNFAEDLTGPCRTIILSSQGTISFVGFDRSGGEFSDSFLKDLRNPDDDIDGDGCISEKEAFESAKKHDRAHNEGRKDKNGKLIKTDPKIIDPKPCECSSCEDKDSDNDKIRDNIDPDDDNDGIPDCKDNCPIVYNPDQKDFDKDKRGNTCDPDDDNDGIPDSEEKRNCHRNPDPRCGGDPPIYKNIMVFPTPERFIGSDLNNDGDTNDTVLRYKNLKTGEVVNTGLIASGAYHSMDIYENIIAFVGKGSQICYYDINIETVGKTGITGSHPSIYGNIITFTSNGAIHYFDLNTQRLVNTGVPGKSPVIYEEMIVFHEGSGPATWAYELTIEQGEIVSCVFTPISTIWIYDLRSGVAVNTGIIGENPTFYEAMIAFETHELSAGKDLNGDGDTNDWVVMSYDLETKTITNTRAVGRYPALHGNRIVFTTSEKAVNQDLNGDNKIFGNIIRYYDLKTSHMVNTQQLGTEPDIYEDTITFYLWERWTGRDLNGDGDLSDPIVDTYQIAVTEMSLVGSETWLFLALLLIGSITAYFKRKK